MHMNGQTSPLKVRDHALTPPSGNDLEIELEELIFSEWANPGDRLPSERALADHFRVSRPLLRETLRALEGRGLIRIEAGRGAFIEDLTQADHQNFICCTSRFDHSSTFNSSTFND